MLLVGFFLPICWIERVCLHLPLTLVYNFATCFGMVASFYHNKNQGKFGKYEFTIDHEIPLISIMTISQLILQYCVVIVVTLMQTQLSKYVSQLQLTKESLNIIVNHLNQAIFLKNERGSIIYSNDLGLKLIKSINSTVLHQSETQLNIILNRLTSMNQFLYSALSNQKSDVVKIGQELDDILNVPIFKIKIEGQQSIT